MQEKEPVKYSKVIVALIIVLNTVFATAVLWLYYKTGDEPKTLITAWFTSFTGELFALAGITMLDKNKSKDTKQTTTKENKSNG